MACFVACDSPWLTLWLDDKFEKMAVVVDAAPFVSALVYVDVQASRSYISQNRTYVYRGYSGG